MTADASAATSLKPFFRGSPIRWLIAGGCVLVVAIMIGAIFTAAGFRERALKNTARELQNTVLLLTRHFDQQFEDFDFAQKSVIDYIHSTGITSAESYRQRLSGEDVHQVLESKISVLSYVGAINVFDAEGQLINSSAAWPAPPLNVADRTYFQAFKNNPQSPPMLVEPVHSRMNGAWITVIARKVTGPKGEFLGAIGRGIEPAGFEKFFESLSLGNGASISMFHSNGTLLARYPHIDATIGMNYVNGPIHQQVLNKSDEGTMYLTSAIDGADRVAAARKSSKFPISIVATTTVAAALANWREQIEFLAAITGLAVLAISGLLFLVVRKLLQQHQKAQQRLALEKWRLDTAVNNMTQGLVLFDSQARIVICNHRYIELHGLSRDVVKPGCSFRDLIAYRKRIGSFKGDVDELCSTVLRQVAQGKVPDDIEETTDGRSILIVNTPLTEGGWVVTQEDITGRRRAEERITHLAHYDALTDLPNRVLFHERLTRELADMTADEQLAVFYIDIDEFKSVNDSLGHMIGDQLLKSIAASLQLCVGDSDFVSRLGGDEFAIVQIGVRSLADVTDLVTKIFNTIRMPYQCLGQQVATDASIGIALVPQHGAGLEQILKNADLAMYAAKSAGRHTYRFFEPEMDARVTARRNLEMDLRQAIADGALEVHYQPFVSLRDNAITGCEALLRWPHPERGMISPAEFIPIAEDTGLINQLGEWVLTTACMEAMKWPEDIKLAVNVSPVQFRSGTLALKIVAALAASGLPANRLELEITEAVLIRDDEAALAILHQLRELGVHIALDDFGTGYSSLSYLQRFPFDKIKIDRCFVEDLAEPDGSSSIVRAVVNIAAARHMTTTAEGVQTERQRELLRALGCTEMQGYLFSPARPAVEIRRMLFEHRQKSVPASPRRTPKRRSISSIA